MASLKDTAQVDSPLHTTDMCMKKTLVHSWCRHPDPSATPPNDADSKPTECALRKSNEPWRCEGVKFETIVREGSENFCLDCVGAIQAYRLALGDTPTGDDEVSDGNVDYNVLKLYEDAYDQPKRDEEILMDHITGPMREDLNNFQKRWRDLAKGAEDKVSVSVLASKENH
ncbi:hypothetical protein F5Y16DRAFT_401995 [Xylariaceae sp. FL0255]|nr:hypothetical protein F5Y16DRAFT_401995 [Xylariaceae sp. FL0255]